MPANGHPKTTQHYKKYNCNANHAFCGISLENYFTQIVVYKDGGHIHYLFSDVFCLFNTQFRKIIILSMKE